MENIIEGVKNIVEERDKASSPVNNLHVTVQQIPETETSKVELFCCGQSESDGTSIIADVTLPSQLEKQNKKKIPSLNTSDGTIGDVDTVVVKEITSFLDNIDFSSISLAVPDDKFEVSGIEPLSSTSEGSSTLPKIQVASAIPVNPFSEKDEIQRTLEETLVEVTENLIGNDTTVSGVDKVDITISQNVNNLQPSVEVSCCEKNGIKEPSIAKVDVKLPSQKNITNTFQLSKPQNNEKIEKDELKQLLKNKFDSIVIDNDIKTTTTPQNKDHTSSDVSTATQQLSYEAVIPIPLDQEIQITKQQLVDETVTNIRNIIDLSPEDSVTTLTIKAKKGTEDSKPNIKVSCCDDTEHVSNKSSVEVVITVPYEVEESNSPVIFIPIIKDSNIQKSKLNSTAIKKLLLDGLETSTLEQDLSSLTPVETDKQSSVKTKLNPTKLNFEVPIQSSVESDQEKQSTPNNPLPSIKDANKEIETALVAIVQNLIEHDSVSSVEEVNVKISQSSDHGFPSIEVDCCGDSELENLPTANIQVKLPSQKNVTEAFKLSTLKDSQKLTIV